jgi:Ser-tRNA(Ala) deacylase AlaX
MAEFAEHVNPTQKLYLDDTYMLACVAELVSYKYDEEKKVGELIVNKTVFYPQGGGQPTGA